MHLNIYVCRNIYIYIYIYTHISIYACVCIIYTFTSKSTWTYMKCMCEFVLIAMNIHRYTSIHTYIKISIYIYLYVFLTLPLQEVRKIIVLDVCLTLHHKSGTKYAGKKFKILRECWTKVSSEGIPALLGGKLEWGVLYLTVWSLALRVVFPQGYSPRQTLSNHLITS